MSSQRRRRGFERAGAFRPEQAGLPARRARELRITLAWRRAAGEALTRCVSLRGVFRGVLEVQAPEERWVETLRELLPGIAERMGRAEPALRIRACRIRTGGHGGVAVETLPLRGDSAPAAGEPGPGSGAARADSAAAASAKRPGRSRAAPRRGMVRNRSGR